MTGETMTNTRSQEEILKRITTVADGGNDWLGIERQDLMGFLDYEHVLAFLKDGTTEATWNESRESVGPRALIVDYLPFAIQKAVGHRGISAGRAVAHFRAWVWLIGDEEFEKIDWEDYAQYGAPILKAVARLVEADWPDDDDINRMARGDVCDPDGCYEGCGS